MALQSLDVRRRSATTLPEPEIREPREGEVAKLIDVSKCIGCKACQSACMEWNELRDEIGVTTGVYDNPRDLTENSWTVMRFSEYDNPQTGNLEWLIRKDGCMHCEDPGCLKACPSPGAIVQYTNGIVDFHEENCIGCGYCVTGCPFDVPRISKKDSKAYKCTLCSDRVAVGQEPACVKACPTGAIMFGTKKSMKDQAVERIEDLKSRGFEQAGLYDPAGVGGTHVMYVLHHADQPSLYHGLPANPRISPLVSLWKGVAKPLALGAIALTALVGFFHYTRVGPNETGDPEPAKADAPPANNAANAGQSLIERYTPNARSNHWTTAICFVLLALSGLALFHPALFWLSAVLGGGPWTRILHPFIGVAMFVSFSALVLRFWRHNFLDANDWRWLRQMRDVVNNREDRLPAVGRYNAGQKLLFWTLVASVSCLLLTGLVIWRAYFSHLFPIGVIRAAALLHAFFAFVLICAIVVHVYAAIWVKGSFGAMVRGTVSRAWARRHHARWYDEVVAGEKASARGERPPQ